MGLNAPPVLALLKLRLSFHDVSGVKTFPPQSLKYISAALNTPNGLLVLCSIVQLDVL